MIYLGTENGLYRWYEGAPWPVFHGLQGRSVLAIDAIGAGVMAAADATGRVWESTSNGLDWRESPLPTGSGRPTGLALAGAPAWLWVATRPVGLFRKPMGAGPWTGVDAPTVAADPVAPAVRTLAAAPGALLAAVEGAGLWRVADACPKWARCAGLPDGAEVYAIRPGASAKAPTLAATGAGVWASDDGGANWVDRSGNLAARHVRAVAARPDDPDYWLAGAATAAEPARPGLQFGLYESRDAGKTWAQVKRGFPDDLEFDQIADIRFDPVATDCAIVALASGECWRTKNGGDWWEPIARQIRAVRAMCGAV